MEFSVSACPGPLFGHRAARDGERHQLNHPRIFECAEHVPARSGGPGQPGRGLVGLLVLDGDKYRQPVHFGVGPGVFGPAPAGGVESLHPLQQLVRRLNCSGLRPAGLRAGITMHGRVAVPNGIGQFAAPGLGLPEGVQVVFQHPAGGDVHPDDALIAGHGDHSFLFSSCTVTGLILFSRPAG